MGFSETEQSNYGGKPVALYDFALGDYHWRYAAAEDDPVVEEATYTGVPISDSGVIQSGDVQNDSFVVSISAEAEFLDLYIATPPSDPVYLVCRRWHRGDTDSTVSWVGTVKAVSRVDQTTFTITCKVATASLDRLGLRLAWGRNCPHALYDRLCTVNKATYAVTGTISALTGGSLTVAALSAKADGWFSGGFIEFVRFEDVVERRGVEDHTGSVVTMLGATDGLEVGMSVTAYPGCDRTVSTCANKFSNSANYGGFPHMPGVSPFDGKPVF